uniref:Uncharacterized protein n=1 Tax=Arundo donax TaxID=35708 RepID=A0A0A8Y4C9_ARUDO
MSLDLNPTEFEPKSCIRIRSHWFNFNHNNSNGSH